MKYLTSIVIVLSTLASYSQIVIPKWNNTFGGSNNDGNRAMHCDTKGNIYLTGYFSDRMDIDPSSITDTRISNGSTDIVIQKLDTSGALIWGHTLGGTSADQGYSIYTDKNQNVIIAGMFSGTVDFDPGSGTFTKNSNGLTDIFILKLDSNGKFDWVYTVGGSSYDHALDIAVDSNQNIFAVGTFRGTVDFDASSKTVQRTSNGFDDIFVLTITNNGGFRWVKSIGGSTSEVPRTITCDKNEILVSGNFTGIVDFDPNSGVSRLTSQGQSDAFLLRLQHNGNYVWVKQIKCTLDVISMKHVVDNHGNIITVGFHNATADFNPSNTVSYNLTPRNKRNFYVQKLDSTGSFVWTKTFHGDQYANAFDVDVNRKNQIFITGFFEGNVDFDPSPTSSYVLQSLGSNDVFIQKLTPQGTFQFAYLIGGTATNSGINNKIDYHGNLLLSGNFEGLVDFNPGLPSLSKNSNGRRDYFVQRHDCVPLITTDSIIACDSIIWIDGKTYKSNNSSATFLTVSKDGCDSLIQLKLTINESNTGSEKIHSCDSLTWINGITYYKDTSGVESIISNQFGCDSTVTLELTISNSYYKTDSVYSCDSYQWSDGIVYHSSTDTAKMYLTTKEGCDSITSLNLELKRIDTTIKITQDSLISNELFGKSYQWYSCSDTNHLLTNDTLYYLIPKTTGNYFVKIETDSCSDTSVCVLKNVEKVSVINNNQTHIKYKLYPNPTESTFIIQTNNQSISKVSVFNLKGEKLMHYTTNSTSIIIDSQLPKGIYFVQINDSDVLRLVITK